MERPGVLKSVSSIFVFLAAFLAVANFLGGGMAGLITAGALAAIAVVVYLVSYGQIARFPSVRRLLESESGSRTAQRKRPRPQPAPPEPDLNALLTRGSGMCAILDHTMWSLAGRRRYLLKSSAATGL